MASSYIAVRVDEENNAAQWWDALAERCPRFARCLRRDGAAVIRAELWDDLAALPGFDDGPAHARTALIDCGNEGDGWLDVVATRHGVWHEWE